MLFSTQGFQGALTKKVDKGGDKGFVRLTIKHTEEGEIQSFLDDVEKTLNVENVKPLFTDRVIWDKINIKNLAHDVSVEFDEVEFDALLVEINVARKVKNGIESFEYNIVLQKEVSDDNLDRVLTVEYLGRKHEDSDGKTKVTLFQTKLKTREKKVDDTAF